MNRRDFLKTGLVFTGGLALGAAAKAALPERKDAFFRDARTLNNGGLTVSALGFGCMGLTYNRSRHPEKSS